MDPTWPAIVHAAAAGERVALATVIGVNGSAPRSAGARMVVWPDGRIAGTVGGGNFEARVIEAALEALREGTPRRFQVHLTRDLGMCCGGAMEVYIEPLAPTDRLVLFGAGHVAKATAAFAREAGWSVTVVDDRDDQNTAERFPGCERCLTDPRGFARRLVPDGRTWVFVVTHDHQLDQDLIELLVPHDWAWLGLIGSRAKVTRFHLRLRAAGVPVERLARVSGPVGLDIGAETPAEIAVSVLAEMVRVRRQVSRPPLPMRIAGA
jgi:xanthine dehydrogenase accessory factor